MATINVTLLDTRAGKVLANQKPDDRVLGPADSMIKVFDDLGRKFGKTGNKIGILGIIAHGYVEFAADGSTLGGFGIQFCSEDILEGNVREFDRLRRAFVSRSSVGIELIGCSVAATSTAPTPGTPTVGDGVRLCQMMADAAQTCVRVSPDDQQIGGGLTRRRKPGTNSIEIEEVELPINPGPWEGRVWVFKPGGKNKWATEK
jgi:hypothetical protein